MQISETGSKDSLQQRGLTLVELLVVLAVLSLSMAVAMLTIHPQKSDAERTASEIGRMLIMLHQRSILAGDIYGLKVEQDQYYLMHFEAGRWRETGFAEGSQFPESVRGAIETEELLEPGTAGGNMFAEPTVSLTRREPTIRPDIVFSPSGLVTPSKIILDSNYDRWVISISATGEVDLAPHDGEG